MSDQSYFETQELKRLVSGELDEYSIALNFDEVTFDYAGRGVETTALPEKHWYAEIHDSQNRFSQFWDAWSEVKTPDYGLTERVSFRYDGPSGVTGTLRRPVYDQWVENFHGYVRTKDFWNRWSNA